MSSAAARIPERVISTPSSSAVNPSAQSKALSTTLVVGRATNGGELFTIA